MSLFNITVALFLIMDSVGSITDFLNLIREIPPSRKKWVIAREMLIALFLMFIFYIFGGVLLESLEVTSATVRIAAGLVLFLIAIRMIFPQEKRMFVATDKEDPLIVPIATPMIAGPSILATVMFYAYDATATVNVMLGMFIAWVLSVSVFWFAYKFEKHISPKALSAGERLMGLILTLMAVEMFLKGLRIFILSQ